MTYGPGDVVWHRAPFKGAGSDESPPDRPWLVLSNESHPFHGTEYVVAGMTTTAREMAIPVEPTDWTSGGGPTRGYVSPWFLMTLKAQDVSDRLGTLREALVGRAVAATTGYLGPT